MYASYATGYKGGGVNPRPFYIQQEQQFGPETLTAYELGLKTRSIDDRVHFNLTGFYYDYRDAQIPITVPLGSTATSLWRRPYLATHERRS